ncbi:MAG TPA: MFS transporter [Gaiellaceae bacterium]|nr:MFS transporter [Gaiellaceae bacterium]
MTPVRARIGESAEAFRNVFANKGLRNLELAWAASIVSTWAYMVAISVYAYDIGGEGAVGVLLLLRLVPAGLLAPFAGVVADRYPRERVLFFTNLARIALITASGVGVLVDVDAAVVYALSIGVSITNTPFRPAQAALTPSLARSPSELTAANAVASTIESLAGFVGPALAGILLGVVDTGVVLLLTAALVALSTLYVLGVHPVEPATRRGLEASTIASEAVVGFRTITRDSSLRVLVGLFTAQTFVAGAVQVYIVVIAIQLLDLGSQGVGYLNAAVGVGALVGGILALSLTGAKRLSAPFMLGVVLWGAPLIALGLWQPLALSLILFGLLGVGNSLVDVAAFTLVQRAVPDEVLARVFGVIQMLWLASVGIGAIVAPALISALGLESALIVTGASLPLLVLLTSRKLTHIDSSAAAPDSTRLRLLTSTPIFAPLPGGSLEHVATRLVPLRLDPSTVVVREGDEGDRFYIVAEGELTVTQDGAELTTLGAGDVFGEIALLKEVPRTATVVAKTHAVVYALDRDDFLAAVTGHPQSAEAAENVVSARMAGPAATGYRATVIGS